jgi:hypothetical protein
MDLVINFPTYSTVSTVCVTCVWAGVDNAWEQEKLEARKMLENAADRASEPPASIAQSKRIGACHPTRQVHALLGGGFGNWCCGGRLPYYFS